MNPEYASESGLAAATPRWNPMQPRFDVETLAAQTEWMRRLARRLVGDPHAADDLAQEACLAALERPPVRVGSTRAWLVGVLKNLVRQRGRGEARRGGRESAAARSEALPSTCALVEEIAVQREMVDAVLALDEPFRTAVLLRFYRELPLKRVAEVQGVPLSTAHARVKRGIELLRERLDANHGGDRRAWATAFLPLAPLARGGGGLTPPIVESVIGAMTVSTAAKLAVVSVVVAGGALGVWMAQGTDGEAAERVVRQGTPAPEPEQPKPVDAGVLSDAKVSERVAVAGETEATAPVEDAPGAETVFFGGRVIRLDRRPVAGIRVVVHGADGAAEASATTDAGGRFEMVHSAKRSTLVVDDPVYATVLPGSTPSEPDAEASIVVAERRPVGGVVVDETGTPIAGAELSVQPSTAVFREYRHVHRFHTPLPGRKATTDAEGRFLLEDVAAGDWGFLWVEHDSYASERVRLPEHADLDVEIVLYAPEDAVWGTVIDSVGAPVEGAHVSLGGPSVRTEVDGTFRVDRRLGKDVLVAVKEGHLPARMEDAGELQSPVVLQLGGAPLEITGRVVDEEGKPRADVVVFLRDPTHFGMVEFVSADSSYFFPVHLEDLLAGERSRRGARTDDKGVFRFGGVEDRGYRLQALAPRNLELGPEWEVAGGARDVELLFPREPDRSRVAGRVVSLGGEPLAGVKVLPVRERGELDWWQTPHEARDLRTETDIRGRFSFDELSLEGTRLTFSGHRVVTVPEYDLAEAEDLEEIEVRLPVRCDVQIDLAGRDDLADTFQVLDGAGEPLRLYVNSGNLAYETGEHFLSDGRSEVVGVPETARTVVLRRDGEEVARLPFVPKSSELSVIRP